MTDVILPFIRPNKRRFFRINQKDCYSHLIRSNNNNKFKRVHIIESIVKTLLQNKATKPDLF